MSRPAFTLIELMICLAIVAIIGAIAIPQLLAKKPAEATPRPTPMVEASLSDHVLPNISSARIIVLPTGERVLILSNSASGIGCCLLPSLPSGRVER